MYSRFARFVKRSHRRGAVAAFVVVVIPVMIGFAALTVDVGYLYNVRAELQNAADATALSAAQLLPNVSAVKSTAFAYAVANQGHHGAVLKDSDLVTGYWDVAGGVFQADGKPTNAVRVTVRRAEENGNPVSLMFAAIFGWTTTNVSARATAMSGSVPGRVRFLIDDEVLDTDLPAIQQLAADEGVSPDDLLRDNDGDGFIDIPGGKVLELPTGQTGDEGLFAIESNFEFTPISSPSLVDFLLYNPNGDKRGIPDTKLDPLVSVDPVSDAAAYPNYIDPAQVLVSPIYKSDVSNTSPYVQAKGQRRGLWAFKIIAVGADPDGNGSCLPNLVFESVDPATIDLDSLVVTGGASGSLELVE